MKNKTIEGAFIVAGTALFLTAILPMADALGNLVCSAINKSINKMQISMNLDAAEGQAAAEVIAPAPSSTNAIGFQIEAPIEEEEEYD